MLILFALSSGITVLSPLGSYADGTGLEPVKTEPLKVYIPNIIAAATLPDYFDAAKLEYIPELSRVSAVGDVEIAKDDKIVRADSIEYDQIKGRVVARGNIVILEPDGSVVFSDEKELKSGIKESVISQFREHMADNGLFMEAEAHKALAQAAVPAAQPEGVHDKSFFGRMLAYVLPRSQGENEALQYAALAPSAGGGDVPADRPVIGNVPLIVLPDNNSPAPVAAPVPLTGDDKAKEMEPAPAPDAGHAHGQTDVATEQPHAAPAAEPAPPVPLAEGGADAESAKPSITEGTSASGPAKAEGAQTKENTEAVEVPARKEAPQAVADKVEAPAHKVEPDVKAQKPDGKDGKKPAKAEVKKKATRQADKPLADKPKEPPLRPLLDTGVLTPQPENIAGQETEPQESLSPKSREILSAVTPPAPQGKPRPQPPLKVNRAHDMHDLFRADGVEGSNQYEALGIKVGVKEPKVNIDYELDKAYNAISSGQSEAAIETYKNILHNSPNNTQALFGLATMYHRARQFDMARPLYRRLLLIDPQNRDGFNNFLVLLADEAPREALAEMIKLEEANPGFSNIPAQMAVIYEKLGEHDKSIGKMFRAVELAPENLTYRYNLAIMLDRQKNYDEAAKLYRQLIEAAARGEKIPGNIENVQQRLTFISSNRP